MGYGNVGKGVHRAIERSPDMELRGIISRDIERTKSELNNKNIFVADANKFSFPERESWTYGTNVAILCGGSKEDLPIQGPFYANLFNTVDSFDTRAKISEYFTEMNSKARMSNKVAVISTGWDPEHFL